MLLRSKPLRRVQPPRCEACGILPYQCPTCEDFCCKCPVPWAAQKTKGISPRAHYDHDGKPYRARFIDGNEHQSFPSEEEDLLWLIEGGLA